MSKTFDDSLLAYSMPTVVRITVFSVKDYIELSFQRGKIYWAYNMMKNNIVDYIRPLYINYPIVYHYIADCPPPLELEKD